MNKYHPNYYFNLREFAHQALFDNIEFVWQTLSHIHSYLLKQKLGKIEVEIPAGAFLVNPELISIGEGTIVEPGAYIKGPCIIGKNCSVRHGAYIRGDFIAGDNCVIGHDTEVKNSIMLNGAQAGHFAYLGDTILGNQVNLGAGTKCANLKLDHQIIKIQIDGVYYDTGFKKMGSIVGDKSQTGCNSVFNPGTLIGKEVFCYPCTNVGGFIDQKMIVKPNTSLKIRSRN